MKIRKHLTVLALPFVGAADTAMSVLRYNPAQEILSILSLLVSVTAITFILVLFSCGLRDSSVN